MSRELKTYRTLGCFLTKGVRVSCVSFSGRPVGMVVFYCLGAVDWIEREEKFWRQAAKKDGRIKSEWELFSTSRASKEVLLKGFKCEQWYIVWNCAKPLMFRRGAGADTSEKANFFTLVVDILRETPPHKRRKQLWKRNRIACRPTLVVKNSTFKFVFRDERCWPEALQSVQSTYVCGSNLDPKKNEKLGTRKIRVEKSLKWEELARARHSSTWEEYLDNWKCLEAKCREKTLQKSVLEPTAPNRLARLKILRFIDSARPTPHLNLLTIWNIKIGVWATRHEVVLPQTCR